MATIQQQRDNLTIGLFLAQANQGLGAGLDQILTVALGYDPNAPVPMNQVELYERRFRDAQRVGRDAFRERTAGYFTFNAMPFGGIYLYKSTWYVWISPQTNQPQTVPLLSGDLASMRRLRDRDLATRQATARSVRTANNVEEQRRAIARQDWHALRAIQAGMIEDGSLGEILSGFHGLPYAEMQEVIQRLPNAAPGSIRFRFQQNAARITQLQDRLLQEQAALGQQLMNWVMLQTGVPNNAPHLALAQAAHRLAGL